MDIRTLECRDVERDYGFGGIEAIIVHPTQGRILLCDGFGGIDTIHGGAVRWEHGKAVRLQDGDNFSSLDGAAWDQGMTLMQAVQGGYDSTRPVLGWTGQAIAQVAKSAHLE